jgi:hypothetical protein
MGNEENAKNAGKKEKDRKIGGVAKGKGRKWCITRDAEASGIFGSGAGHPSHRIGGPCSVPRAPWPPSAVLHAGGIRLERPCACGTG